MSITGNLYKRVSLFTLSFVLAISSLSVAVPLFLSQTANAASIPVTLSSPQGWAGVDDNGKGGSLAFVNSPTGSLGLGSAQLSVNATNQGYMLYKAAYGGIRLTDITNLSYDTYVKQGNNTIAPSLQFDIDKDVNDSDTSWQGRLVYEPYQNGHASVINGQWQNQDALDGSWWFSNPGKFDNKCPMSAPCTFDELTGSYQNIGIRDVSGGGVSFKAGSGWTNFVGNVDNFTFNSDTYDFESTPVVTAQDFAAWDSSSSFKAINVGFKTDNFSHINAVKVTLRKNGLDIVSNTASDAMLSAINAQTSEFTQNGQLSTPFIVSGTLVDTYCAGGPCWIASSHNWLHSEKPDSAVITVTENGKDYTATNTNLSEATATFDSLIAPDTTSPTITSPIITNNALWGPDYNILDKILDKSNHLSEATHLPVIGGTVQVGADFADDMLLTNVVALLPGRGFFVKDSNWAGVPEGLHTVTWNTKDTSTWQGVPDGNYTFTFNASDGGNGQNQLQNSATKEIPVTVDNTGPTVAFTGNTPNENKIVEGMITVEGNFTDANGLMNTDIGIHTDDRNGEGWKCHTDWPTQDTKTCTINTTELNDGTYQLTMAGKDKAGNVTQVFRTIIIDNIAPSVNFVAPTPGNESYVKGAITGQVSATDAVGMGSYYIRVWKNAFGSGTLVKQCSSAPGGNLLGTSQDVTCGLDTTTLTPGKYVFSAQFLDSSSNWGTAFRTFYVDNTVPTATIDGLAPQSLYNGSTNINVHAIDDNYLRTDIYREGETSPLPYAGVYFGLSWLGNGNYRMVVIDKAGNSTEYKFTIDKTAPTVPSFVMKDSNGVDITNGYITTQYFTVNLTNPSAEGVVRYRLQYSNDFNSLVWNPSDLSATGHMSNLGVYTDNFTQGEGTHSLAFSACDAAGNCSAYSDPFVVTYDNTKPVVTVTTPVADNYGFINTVNINANIDDAVSYSIYVNGTDVHDGIGEYIPYALTVTDGAYDMYIEATDAAGNVGTSLVLTITVDNTAPILTVIGYTGTSLTPTITGTTDGAGYRVTVDGVEATVNSDGTWAYTLPTQTIGTHTISVVSTDIYGNAKTELATVTVNAVPATNTTPATTTTTVTPTGTTTNNTTDQGVLGAQTTKDTTDNTTTPAKTAASILGDSTSKDNGNIWGLVWYWWLVILAAAVAIIWWIVAAMRSRDNQNT